jgi:hypothetical protein
MSTPALTPRAGGGTCITSAALKPADIIVSTTNAFVSGVIRLFTLSSVSHAMLYAGQDEVIEAVGEGVLHRPLATALHDARLAVAYRYKDLPEAAATKIISYADAQAARHAKYDPLGAAGAGLNTNKVACVVALGIACPVAAGGGLNDQDRFFCSELVLDAYQRAGHPLVRTAPGVASPDRIVEAYSHGVLVYVGHLVTG